MANTANADFITRLTEEYKDPSYVYTIQSRIWFFILQIVPESSTNENRENVVDPIHATFNGNNLKVILIVNIHNINDQPNSVEIASENYDMIPFKRHRVVASGYRYKMTPEKSVTIYMVNQLVVANKAEDITYYKTVETALSHYFPFDFTGQWKEWHKNGQMRTMYECVNGKRHGCLTNWIENNNGPSHKWLECYNVNGKLMGPWKEYHAFGPNPLQLRLETQYLNDQYDGKYMKWFANGQIKTMGYYNKGREENKFSHFYKNGNMIEEENYINGILSGKQTRLHDNGVVSEIAYFSDGKLDGMIERWDETGLPINNVNNNVNNNWKQSVCVLE